jgi:hypothetical protein
VRATREISTQERISNRDTSENFHVIRLASVCSPMYTFYDSWLGLPGWCQNDARNLQIWDWETAITVSLFIQRRHERRSDNENLPLTTGKVGNVESRYWQQCRESATTTPTVGINRLLPPEGSVDKSRLFQSNPMYLSACLFLKDLLVSFYSAWSRINIHHESVLSYRTQDCCTLCTFRTKTIFRTSPAHLTARLIATFFILGNYRSSIDFQNNYRSSRGCQKLSRKKTGKNQNFEIPSCWHWLGGGTFDVTLLSIANDVFWGFGN